LTNLMKNVAEECRESWGRRGTYEKNMNTGGTEREEEERGAKAAKSRRIVAEKKREKPRSGGAR